MQALREEKSKIKVICRKILLSGCCLGTHFHEWNSVNTILLFLTNAINNSFYVPEEKDSRMSFKRHEGE